MLKTRRFKALNGAKGEYSGIVEKIAIYDDSGKQIDCCVIHTDEEGREYYYPSNPHEKFGLFTDRPKDAIECIRNGFGDAIEGARILGIGIQDVVRFIDREYGENLRQKTIEGWKNAQFAYAVKFCFLNSFSGGRLVCKDKTLMTYNNTRHDILTFETEREASSFIYEVTSKAERYYEEYINLPRTGDSYRDYEEIVKPFFNTIKGQIIDGKESVYWTAFSQVEASKSTGNLQYKMEVVQVLLPESCNQNRLEVNNMEKEKSVKLYWDDLTPEAQQKLLDLMGDNGNYDVHPIATIYGGCRDAEEA